MKQLRKKKNRKYVMYTALCNISMMISLIYLIQHRTQSAY